MGPLGVQPFVIKTVEVLQASDTGARKQFRTEFEAYLMMEKAYQSGKLQNCVAPHCYGAFESKYIDILILNLHNNIPNLWEQLQTQER